MRSAFGASNDEKSLFIFRRDLRLEDNTGLISALSQAAEHVIPCFILDEQTTQIYSC